MKSILLIYIISFAIFDTNEIAVINNAFKSHIQPFCYEKSFEITSKVVQKQFEGQIRKISDEELPIIVIQRKQDSLLAYVSATMSTKFLIRKHPSYLTKINGRYVAVYSEKKIDTVSDECFEQVVGYYKGKLRFDKLNTKNGTDNAEAGFGYDPIRIKIGIVADNVILVDEHYPYFKPVPVIE